MTTYILGAGPTGMAVADGIVDGNAGPFVLLERGNSIGGLAQTLNWQSVGDHDLGPHKIFSVDKDLIERVEALIPAEEWLTRDKVSTIYMAGHYLTYPPSPFALAGVFGLPTFIKMVAGYSMARLTAPIKPSKPQTFEEDLESRLGKPLYDILFKPIAEKLWGDPKILDVKLSSGRVQTPSLLEVLGRLLKIKKDSEFEALTFRYPKGGLSRLWQAIQTKSIGHGDFLLGHTVTGLMVENNKINQIQFSSDESNKIINLSPDDQIVSTLPLAHTLNILKKELPPHFDRLARSVVSLSDLLLVFLHIDKPSLLDESWIFIPDPKIAFHRISEQESFDPAMTPNGSIVCCEIMSSNTRPMAKLTDDKLIQLATDGLSDMGYSGFNLLNQRVIRLPKSYPVFRTGFEKGLGELLEGLDQFDNFRTIGRQGAFNYIGTLDAMDIGYGYAKWLTNKKTKLWKHERERTNHYPVLD